ncbi:unnamed protein product, partial [Phaeothamnion confervicola]
LPVDTDKSGCLDQAELANLLRRVGYPVRAEAARHCIACYDADRSGLIEIHEFADFMVSEYLTAAPVDRGCVCEGVSSRPWEVPAVGVLRCAFAADSLGPSTIDVATGAVVEAVMSNIAETAKTEQDRLDLFMLATEDTDFFLSASDAQAIMADWSSSVGAVDLLAVLLPQMAAPRAAAALIDANLDTPGKLELRRRLGAGWGPLVGRPTGFYSLDLASKADRTAAKRLAVVNNDEVEAARRVSLAAAAGGDGAAVADTSQKGNWQNFRNETLDGQPLRLEGNWFARLPRCGRLRFDYVSTTVPPPYARAMSHRRFRRLVEGLGLDYLRSAARDPTQLAEVPALMLEVGSIGGSGAVGSVALVVGAAMGERSSVDMVSVVHAVASSSSGNAQEITPGAAKSRHSGGAGAASTAAPCSIIASSGAANGTGWTPPAPTNKNENNSTKSGSVGGGVLVFTAEQALLHHREFDLTSRRQRRRAWEKAELKTIAVPEDTPQSLAGDDGAYAAASGDGGGGGDSSNSSFVSAMPLFPEIDDSVAQEALDPSGIGSSGGNIGGGGAEANEGLGDTELRAGLGERQRPAWGTPLLWREHSIRPYQMDDYIAALARIVDLQVQGLQQWFSIEQAKALVACFPRADFLRVAAAMAIFDRIRDLPSRDMLLDILTPLEEAELLWRLGPLNIYNPRRPDRTYDLDLCSREDREMCKVLVALAVSEPGENWKGEMFRWSHTQRPIPGWELPMSWTSPDDGRNGGPRRFGRLTLTYCSDPAEGCAPIWSMRRELKRHVLAG